MGGFLRAPPRCGDDGTFGGPRIAAAAAGGAASRLASRRACRLGEADLESEKTSTSAP